MAYLRKYSQGMEIPGYNTGSALLGTGQTGMAQPTDAGKPGGWTNIQDYLNANQGDTTNINTAKQQTQEKMQKGAGEVQKQKEGLTALPEATPYDANAYNTAYAAHDPTQIQEGFNSSYGNLSTYQNLPDVSQELPGYAPLEQQYSKIQSPNDFYKTMEFTGSLVPNQPNYTTGMQAFDTMLLQGSPEFRTSFVPQLQEQYQTQYEQPLEHLRDQRMQDRQAGQQAAQEAAQGWETNTRSNLEQERAALEALVSGLNENPTLLAPDLGPRTDFYNEIAGYVGLDPYSYQLSPRQTEETGLVNTGAGSVPFAEPSVEYTFDGRPISPEEYNQWKKLKIFDSRLGATPMPGTSLNTPGTINIT
jgi:hypothetical protein